MGRTLVGSMTLVALGAGAQGPAAVEGFLPWNGCGGNSFATCASVDVSVVGSLPTLRVSNYLGLIATTETNIFRDAGLANLPATISLGEAGVVVTSPSVGDTPDRSRLSVASLTFALAPALPTDSSRNQRMGKIPSPYH